MEKLKEKIRSLNNERFLLSLKIRDGSKKSLFGKSFFHGKDIAIGVAVILCGIFLILSITGKEKPPSKYSEVDTSVKYGISQLETGNDANVYLTMVLYSPDCKDCTKVEKQLVAKYYESRKENKYANKGYMMINVKNISEKRRDRLIEVIGDNKSGDRVEVPYVANLVPTHEGYSIREFSDNGNWKDIKKVIEKGRELE